MLLAQCIPRREKGTTQLVQTQIIPRQVRRRETSVSLLVLVQRIPRQMQQQQQQQNHCWCWRNVFHDGKMNIKNCWCWRNVFHAWTSIQAPVTRHQFVPTQTNRVMNVHNGQPWSTQKQLDFVSMLSHNGHGIVVVVVWDTT